MDSIKDLIFHPDAANHFRDRGQRLLSCLKALSEDRVREKFRADRHPTMILTEKDILHLGPRQTVDGLTMEVTEIAFSTANGLVGLAKDECEEVEKLSEAIQRTSGFRTRVSRKFVRDTILDWLEACVAGDADQDLPSYVLEKTQSAIHLFEIWVPLANLAVEQEVDFFPVRVRPITKELIDGWFQRMREVKSPEEVLIITNIENEERSKIQGLAAAQIALNAERQFAVDKALEKAEEVAACFRLFHPANSKPRAAYYCRPLGRENIESYSVMVVQDDQYNGRTAHMIPPFPDIWELSTDRLVHLEGDLKPVRNLLAAGQRTEFQREVFDAVLLYTRSTMVREPADKLVFIFSALESILLKNENEPIQTHISDRLAFVLGLSVEERKKIVRLVRKCYGFRSEFLHHGRTLEDLATLGEFMMYVWVFFMRLTKFAHRYSVRADFLDEIETMKYSGP